MDPLAALVQSTVDAAKAQGVHPAVLLDALIEFLAEDEQGRGGVDSYVIRDPEGDLVDYTISPHEEW